MKIYTIGPVQLAALQYKKYTVPPKEIRTAINPAVEVTISKEAKDLAARMISGK